MAEEPKLRGKPPVLSGEEVSNDAMQLITISIFNGVAELLVLWLKTVFSMLTRSRTSTTP